MSDIILSTYEIIFCRSQGTVVETALPNESVVYDKPPRTLRSHVYSTQAVCMPLNADQTSCVTLVEAKY